VTGEPPILAWKPSAKKPKPNVVDRYRSRQRARVADAGELARLIDPPPRSAHLHSAEGVPRFCATPAGARLPVRAFSIFREFSPIGPVTPGAGDRVTFREKLSALQWCATFRSAPSLHFSVVS
jgi:hypothetical protein